MFKNAKSFRFYLDFWVWSHNGHSMDYRAACEKFGEETIEQYLKEEILITSIGLIKVRNPEEFTYLGEALRFLI